jgi:hypothetical protein
MSEDVERIRKLRRTISNIDSSQAEIEQQRFDAEVGRTIEATDRLSHDVTKRSTKDIFARRANLAYRQQQLRERIPSSIGESIRMPNWRLGDQLVYVQQLLGERDQENYGLQHIINVYTNQVNEFGISFVEAKAKMQSILEHGYYTDSEIQIATNIVAWKTNNEASYYVSLERAKWLLGEIN